MTDHTHQDETNQAEWENPDNWTTIYFSKKIPEPGCLNKTPGMAGQ